MKPAAIHPAHCRCRACCPRHPSQGSLPELIARVARHAAARLAKLLR